MKYQGNLTLVFKNMELFKVFLMDHGSEILVMGMILTIAYMKKPFIICYEG